MKKVKKKLQAFVNKHFSENLRIGRKSLNNLQGTLIPLPVKPSNEKFFSLTKFFMILLMVSGFSVMQSQAQILKKITKKVEQKVEQRADRKVDKSIDKALDATESEAEKSLKASQENKNNEAIATSNQNATNHASNETLEVPATANLADGLVMVAGDCTDFIWFKEGSKMKFESLDGKGKTMNQSKMVVKKVYNQAGATIADVNMSDDKKNEFTMQFKCAKDKLYMDFSAAVKEMMAKSNPENKAEVKEASENIEMGFSDGFMSFPKNMYPSQMLDDAVFTMKTNSGNMGMDITSSLTGRKVLAKENITTPAGTFECVKVVSNRKTTMMLLGKERNMGKPTQEFVWISPGIGTIKQETYSEKGKLESMSHLIEFEM